MKVPNSVLWKTSQPLDTTGEHVKVYNFGKQFGIFFYSLLCALSTTQLFYSRI